MSWLRCDAMSVCHLSKVVNFDSALASGGTHSFQITLDEMLELENMPGIELGVEIACVYSDRKGVWAGIVNQMAEKGGSCWYKRLPVGTFYEVICTIPQP